VGRLVVAALDKVQGDITRAALLDAITKSGSFDLGGITLRYSADRNRGSDTVFLTVIQSDGSFKSVEKLTKIGS